MEIKCDIEMPDELQAVLEKLPESYLVGGCVRDHLLGSACKDLDVEVFGMAYDDLLDFLRPYGKANLVGKSFGVIKLAMGAGTYDFAIPRTEVQTGVGHKGFQISTDASLPMQTAALRRDFTINALFYDPRRHVILDYTNGVADARNKMLRHTSQAFSEDPLRVLRAMQFAARYDLDIAPETMELCRSIKRRFLELTVPRVWDEWFKWASKSAKPSAGLCFLAASEWISHFPALAALVGTVQDPRYHPEGDVFVHTCLCCDALAKMTEWKMLTPPNRALLMLSVLCHDMGKPSSTTVQPDGHINSHGHENSGADAALQFLDAIGAPNEFKNKIVPLVKCHMSYLSEPNHRSMRRLAVRLSPATFNELFLVMLADTAGHGGDRHESVGYLHQMNQAAAELQIAQDKPKPILLGRHLIACGKTPGIEFAGILNRAFEAQLDGVFSDEAGGMEWLKHHL